MSLKQMNKKQALPRAKVYQTKSGLEFWMDLKSEGHTLKAPTIRTSVPDISIVLVPNNRSEEDTCLFLFKGKKFAFSKPSDQTRFRDNSLETLSQRNPELDIVFTRVGQSQVFWYDHFANCDGNTFEPAQFTIDADTDFGSRLNFEEMTSVFFELMSWMGSGHISMFNGSNQNKNIPHRPVRVGLDTLFLKQLDFRGAARG